MSRCSFEARIQGCERVTWANQGLRLHCTQKARILGFSLRAELLRRESIRKRAVESCIFCPTCKLRAYRVCSSCVEYSVAFGLANWCIFMLWRSYL